jgi:hypothetical protein
VNSLLFAYAEAREIEIRHQIAQRSVSEPATSVRDRLGRTLINWGEYLVATPSPETSPVRPAA